jgi:putative GTP pyrophosphokinase
MNWVKRLYTRGQVDKAGEILSGRQDGDRDWASEVLGNWRSMHAYPLNTFQATLWKRVQGIESAALISRRLKRSPSIVEKLKREKGMNLARMQDIGGLRAVLANVGNVRQLESIYLETGRLTHKVFKHKDYIGIPKSSGYRGVHVVLKYKSSLSFAQDYNGLFLELQIRTRLQHLWATAVETVGTFTNQALKASQGKAEWLEFFALVGSAFAHLEDCPVIAEHKDLERLKVFHLVSRAARNLNVRTKLDGFSVATKSIQSSGSGSSYHLVVLNFKERRLRITNFKQEELGKATDQYLETEKEIYGGAPLQAVLVSAGSLKALRAAYPSYFLDTKGFVEKLDEIERIVLGGQIEKL